MPTPIPPLDTLAAEPVTFSIATGLDAAPLVAATFAKALADRHRFTIEATITTTGAPFEERLAGRVSRLLLAPHPFEPDTLTTDLTVDLEGAATLVELITEGRLTAPVAARTDPLNGALRALVLELEVPLEDPADPVDNPDLEATSSIPEPVDNPGDNPPAPMTPS
jgi:hypothetical protein